MKRRMTVHIFMVLVFACSIYPNVQAGAPKVYSNRDDRDHSKLKAYLFKRGIMLRSGNLSYPEYAGAYFEWPASGDISTVFSFVKKGGRAWIYGIVEISQNDLFQNIFEVGFASEYVTKMTRSATIDGSSLSLLWSGLKVGPRADFQGAISTYLVIPSEEEWLTAAITSQTSGRKRITSAYRKIGKGEVLLMTGFTYGTLLDDGAIELLDNEEAVVNRMFPWLAGQREYE